MPLINIDVKALEWCVAAYLADDDTAITEILLGIDQHLDNQSTLGLPSRLVAKTFVFRLLYGGSAYSYSNDPDFNSISSSKKYWQVVIDKFYTKYSGIQAWHKALLKTVMVEGKYQSPSGRYYQFKYKQTAWGPKLPETNIKNYIVQGFGADIVALARVELYKKIRRNSELNQVLFVNTVHDSIVLDLPYKDVKAVIDLTNQVFRELTTVIEKRFSLERPFRIPLTCEIEIGEDWYNMVDVAIFSCLN